jgi:hypothetical protein
MASISDDGWPAYQVGPRDSIFAIGVVSIKYSQLEFALGVILRRRLTTNNTLILKIFA